MATHRTTAPSEMYGCVAIHACHRLPQGRSTVGKRKAHRRQTQSRRCLFRMLELAVFHATVACPQSGPAVDTVNGPVRKYNNRTFVISWKRQRQPARSVVCVVGRDGYTTPAPILIVDRVESATDERAYVTTATAYRSAYPNGYDRGNVPASRREIFATTVIRLARNSTLNIYIMFS